MTTLIVYYSMGGNTEWTARKIAEELGAEMLRLEPVKAYPDSGFAKFFWGGKSAVMAEKPELRPYKCQQGRYDIILFGLLLKSVFGRNSPVNSTIIVESIVFAGTCTSSVKPLKIVALNSRDISIP